MFDKELSFIFNENYLKKYFKDSKVKRSYLFGIACGSLMIAHKMRLYKGGIPQAVSWGILTFAITGSLHLYTLETKSLDEYEIIKKTMKERNIIEDPNSPKPL
mmetsp:Transcript_23907/g.21748  ORF Transcript_23907/g.21748 Transcript_23907/m.21748 type:complete len:103 (-) Transcript_23907:13-321(-)